MYTLLTLFFISLAGTSFMIGRRVAFIRNGKIIHTESIHPFVPDLEKVKHSIWKSAKRGLYVGTFITVRLYVQSGNFLKNRYGEIKNVVKNRLSKRKNIDREAKQESSKFLRMMSDYKHRVRNMKKQIVEEERRQG